MEMTSKRNIKSLFFILALLLCMIPGCGDNSDDGNSNPSDEETVNNIQREIANELNPGEFRIDTIEDGDTLRLVGIRKSVRLLCVDTEEIFSGKKRTDKKLAYDDWDAYLRIHHNPGEIKKYPTPWGDAAEEFAKEFFKNIRDVIIEYDSLERTTGFFHRHLCYAIVEKDGSRINFNVELVRNGFTPYYTKYGYSSRYHEDFIAAENEARKKKVGIWNNKTHCYPDYDERISLGTERANAIRDFDNAFSNNDEYFMLANETDWSRLKDFIGEEISVFGTIDQIRKKGPPYRLFMAHKQGELFLLYTDDADLHKLIIEKHFDDKFIYISGVLEKDDKYYSMRLIDEEQIKSPDIEYSDHE